MKTKYDAYNSWVSFFIVTCETLITGGLFYLLFLTTEDTPWHKILQAPHLQVILTVMLCYFVSAMQAGVVLYRVWVRINPDNHLIIRVFCFYRAY